MTGSIGESELGKEPSSTTASDYVAQLGRISGKALQPNLVRNGVDLTFRNSATDPDLIYLSVNNNRIGIEGKRSLPSILARPSGSLPEYTLDVNDDFKSTQVVAIDSRIGNILISGSQFSTVVGPINIVPNQSNPVVTIERLITDDLEFNDNIIRSFNNSNIILEASDTGTVELESTTNIYADLDVSGDINLDGNLSKQGNIIIGDEIADIVIINTDFTQSIIPGDNNTYDLGKSNKKWNKLFTPEVSPNVGTIFSNIALISNQLKLDGPLTTISLTQGNTDLELIPDSGIVYLEQTKWQDGDITNLLDTPLTLVSTGIGYVRFADDNAMIVPSGTTSERRPFPEVGETRWNTNLQQLECYDGTVWLISIGPGELITTEDMEDFSNIWALVLG
jgi:hypothetical protein